MRRRGAKEKNKGRKATGPKRRIARRLTRRHDASTVDLKEQLHRRTQELEEALQREAATAEVLEIISSSPGDLEPVFRAILEQATGICDAKFGIVFRYDGGLLERVMLGKSAARGGKQSSATLKPRCAAAVACCS